MNQTKTYIEFRNSNNETLELDRLDEGVCIYIDEGRSTYDNPHDGMANFKIATKEEAVDIILFLEESFNSTPEKDKPSE